MERERTDTNMKASGAKPAKRMRFGEIAVKLGYMSEEDLKGILSRKNISRQLLGQICKDEGLIDDEKLARIMADQYACRYVDLNEIADPKLLKLVPVEFMVKNRFVPHALSGDTLEIAMAEPMDYFKVAGELGMMLDHEIAIVVASESRIDLLLKRIERLNEQERMEELGASGLGDAGGASDDRLHMVKKSASGEYVLSAERIEESESKIVGRVDFTIFDAINKGASDIHFETTDYGMIIRYRIDGTLHQVAEPLPVQDQALIVSRLKVMSELDISETRVPQDGRFKLKVGDRFIDFRVSVLPASFGENVVIRILDQEKLAAGVGGLRLSNMRLPDHELIRIRRMIRAPYGMFLMTGPTGSGKTSTLYRALSEVNSKDTKIITIEDPVEYQLRGITQIPVNEKKGLTFAKGLRAILRHDPDKLLVGEIRDRETAEIAVQSALTGHLVFTTVHANSSFEVINRFIHMGIEPYNLMSALNCIVAQRLIRTLCDCKVAVNHPDGELRASGLDPSLCRDQVFYDAKGCHRCKGTGYRGRKAIIELVELDDDMKEMFIKRASASDLKRKATGGGTTFLRGAALHEVRFGETTLAEANRVTFIESAGEEDVSQAESKPDLKQEQGAKSESKQGQGEKPEQQENKSFPTPVLIHSDENGGKKDAPGGDEDA